MSRARFRYHDRGDGWAIASLNGRDFGIVSHNPTGCADERWMARGSPGPSPAFYGASRYEATSKLAKHLDLLA